MRSKTDTKVLGTGGKIDSQQKLRNRSKNIEKKINVPPGLKVLRVRRTKNNVVITSIRREIDKLYKLDRHWHPGSTNRTRKRRTKKFEARMTKETYIEIEVSDC